MNEAGRVEVVEEDGYGDSFKRRRRPATILSLVIAAENQSSFIVEEDEVR